jgi:hypothetical protein
MALELFLFLQEQIKGIIILRHIDYALQIFVCESREAT